MKSGVLNQIIVVVSSPALGDKCVLGKSIQEGPHSALVDARATMELYPRERGRIEKTT